MKKSIIAIAILSILSLGGASLYAWGWGPGSCRGQGPGWGQGPGGGHGHGFSRLIFMKDYLGLSEEQLDKIAKIDSEYRYQYFKNRNTPEKFDALRTEHKKAVESVLTDIQKKKWDEFYKNRAGRGHGSGPRP
jgi:hypothetical protein